ncbi:unknown [Roseburia sp. CAG:303]|nr:unknown [Roseburia sp. CAG:303]
MKKIKFNIGIKIIGLVFVLFVTAISGNLVNGINGFIDGLQSIMKKIKLESSRLEASVLQVSEQITISNLNADQISSGMDELSNEICP